MTLVTDPIERFNGAWGFLSNFFPAQLNWEGATYKTSEHAFNAGKTTDPERRLWVAAAPSPGEAKERGRRLKLRPEWDEKIRYEVMADVLFAKFAYDAERVRRLMLTGDRHLIEGNDWHDVHWGVCSCRNHGFGENHLGRLLMELREKLR